MKRETLRYQNVVGAVREPLGPTQSIRFADNTTLFSLRNEVSAPVCSLRRLLFSKQTVSTSSVREVREKVGAAPCGCPITGRLQQTASTLMDTLLTDIVG
ncbi:hypothetical protein L6R29_17670, partial [Myxococcota bacterium]|nr:hypothetical protein [Myxococcota bacterium]